MNLQNNKNTAPRIDGLDGLRGIAIAMVMVHHMHSYLLVWWPAGGGLAEGDVGQLMRFLWVGVDLFYVLSGFFIALAVLRPKQWDPVRFARNRLTRILPAYYLSMLLVLVFIEYAMLGDARGWTVIGLHVLMLHHLQSWSMFLINGPYWTLGIEFSFYLLMLAVAPWWRMRQGWLVVPLFLLTASLWRAGVYQGVEESQRFFFAAQLPGALDEFALGMLAAWGYQHRWFDLRGPREVLAGLITLTVGVAVVVYCLHAYALKGVPYWGSAWHVVWSKTALGTGFASLLICFLIWRDHNPLLTLLRWTGVAGLGRISYSVYLYDVPIKLLMYRHVEFLHAHVMGFVVGCVASTVLVAWLSHRFVETRWHPSA